MAGALADFSRRPPGVRIAVYVGVAAVLGLLYYQVMLGPVREALKTAESDREAAIGEAQAISQQKKQRDALLQKQEELKGKIEANQKALPTDAEMPAFFDMLARKFNESGVKVIRREIKPEVFVDEFVKAPVVIEVAGTYYQVKQFFASLRPRVDRTAEPSAVGASDKDRIVTIEDVTVFDPRVLGSQLVMTAKFTASTFRTVPPPAPPPGAAPAAATPAAPAAGTPTAPATAPATGAATPGPATTAPSLSPAEATRAAEAANAAADKRAREANPDDDEAAPPAGSAAPRAPGKGLERIQGGGL